MKRLGIKGRLYVLVACALAGLAAVTGLSHRLAERIFESASYSTVNTVPSLLVLEDAFEPLAHIRVQLWQHLAQADPTAKATLEQAMKDNRARVDEALARYEPLLSDEPDKRLLAADREALQRFDALSRQALDLSRSDRGHEARDLLMANQGAAAAIVEALREHRRYNETLGKAGATEAERIHDAALVYLLSLAGLTLAALAWLGIATTRRLLRQLGTDPAQLCIAASRVERGDLGAVEGADTAPAGSVLSTLGAMQRALSSVVTAIRESADSVATGSGQIAQGNRDLSQRTEEQASSIQQTAASMEQLSTTVQQNSTHATQASDLAHAASDVAQRGGGVMNEVVETMQRIDASSKKIADIIGVIDGIAFQTNILALNAAVEAARAGEQGRGFAVVAGEVRALAQRSADAAREIKALITASVEQVNNGSGLVARAGETMAEVVESIRKVSTIVAEISRASQEQACGIEQVGQAVTLMDAATQQNAALVEEGTAAAESLRNQADAMVTAVGVFQVAGRA